MNIKSLQLLLVGVNKLVYFVIQFAAFSVVVDAAAAQMKGGEGGERDSVSSFSLQRKIKWSKTNSSRRFNSQI